MLALAPILSVHRTEGYVSDILVPEGAIEDASHMTFTDETFDLVTMVFAPRNAPIHSLGCAAGV